MASKRDPRYLAWAEGQKKGRNEIRGRKGDQTYFAHDLVRRQVRPGSRCTGNQVREAIARQIELMTDQPLSYLQRVEDSAVERMLAESPAKDCKEPMPLRIVEDGRYEKPTIVCDHCGEAITDVNDAHYQWRFDGRGDYPAQPYASPTSDAVTLSKRPILRRGARWSWSASSSTSRIA